MEIHRIANPGKQPVILMHGVLDSSMAWVLTGPKRSLGKTYTVIGNLTKFNTNYFLILDSGFLLYDQNYYDVWLLNARGNDFSTGHIKYHRNRTQRERKKYWDFSWHEIGKYDLAASIDYVLTKTDYSKCHYIAHSQGSTSFFVLTSERPEYNDKILLVVALAPPVFMTHIENSFFRILSRHLTEIEVIHFAHEQLRLMLDCQKCISILGYKRLHRFG